MKSENVYFVPMNFPSSFYKKVEAYLKSNLPQLKRTENYFILTTNNFQKGSELLRYKNKPTPINNPITPPHIPFNK
jgi:hypothetical protein